MREPGEAAERFADRHHAQLQGPVAHLLDHLAHRRGRLDHFDVGCAPRREAGSGARDHQFSDQGDQLVQLVGSHAHEAALDRLALLDQILFLERGIDQLVLHRALAHEDLADPVPSFRPSTFFLETLLQRQAFLELAPGKRAALHQQLAQARLILG